MLNIFSHVVRYIEDPATQFLALLEQRVSNKMNNSSLLITYQYQKSCLWNNSMQMEACYIPLSTHLFIFHVLF